ncbi:hypothetical protein LTR62_000198 [Meristemomyces frigidus]|uniref:Cullin family profile domain-containing protein n=1 Tax=Meristemomyces frigidus TaxID=1508187 RepID=A0AAN7YL39_9PEZI|nr:hypothetical protein LTR62_000198 [Meristemomyces frigidus]
MKPPASVPTPTAPPADRKRKRVTRQPSSEEAAKQRTLQSLFTVQQKPHSIPTPTSPSSKRHRTDVPPPSTPPRALSRAAMYSFASRSPLATGSNGVVDLTNGSPPVTPQTRRTSGSLKSRTGINPHTGARKLVVKNLKQNSTWDSKAYLEKIWGQLDAALTIIFKDGNEGFSKEDLYRGVENVCRQDGARTLFDRLEGRCRQHVEQDMRQPMLEKAGLDNVSVLKAVLAEWFRWKEQMVTIRAIFFFLDRSYLLPSTKPTILELTPQLFREIVFSHESLKSTIVNGACDLVASERIRKTSVDQSLFKQAVEMFHELQVYTSSFEPRFLGTTQQYVAQWSDVMIAEKSVPEYVMISEQFIAAELARCEDYALDASTRRDLLALLEDHLVVRKDTDLTEYEPLAALLDRSALPEITALYGLLNRRRLGNKLRPAFEKWVDETGTSVVFGKEEDMVTNLLSLKRRLDLVWKSAFLRDETLGHALRETFEIFMNKTKKGEATWGTDNTKVGEMIAKYVDQLLRGGAKAIPDVLTMRRASSINAPPAGVLLPTAAQAAVEENNDDDDLDEDSEISMQLDQVLDLFRFVHGKAVFEAFYKKDLARRLLMARSASADAERSMLTRLKTECGSGFTQNLEQMFKDVELAREEMQSYKQRLEDRIGYEKGKAIDLSVNILSAAAWPTYPDIPVVIPANVKKAIDDFELHYKSKHNGPEAEVNRTLQSLACAKLRPLTKHPRSRDVHPTDTFSLNPDFTHPKYRIKINQVQLKETREENKETHIRVAEDRNFECQAAVVRILKSRKTIGHQELISETIKATMGRGVLGVADIKRNIERLIEKDYMEREEGNMYSYIA